MKAKTQLWHMLVITLALLITACGGSSGSAGSSAGGSAGGSNSPVNWDYSPCKVYRFLGVEVPDNRIEENLYAGQSTTKQGTLGIRSLLSFQFSLQESGTITVSEIGIEHITSFLLSANDCTKLPLTGRVPKGPYYVSIANYTDVVYEYSLSVDLK